MTPQNLRRYVAAYVVYVAFLHAYPGPWRKWGGEQRTVFDTWTLTHIIWGSVAGYLSLEFTTFTALGIFNEMVESYLRHIKFLGLWGEPEGKKNVAIGIAANSLGWLLGNHLAERAQYGRFF